MGVLAPGGGSSAIPGDPGAIRAAAKALESASNAADQALTQIDNGRDTALGGWRGAAADAFEDHVDTQRKTADQLIDLGGKAAPPLYEYADALAAAKSKYSSAQADKITAQNKAQDSDSAADQQQYEQDASDAQGRMDAAIADVKAANELAAQKILALIGLKLASKDAKVDYSLSTSRTINVEAAHYQGGGSYTKKVTVMDDGTAKVEVGVSGSGGLGRKLGKDKEGADEDATVGGELAARLGLEVTAVDNKSQEQGGEDAALDDYQDQKFVDEVDELKVAGSIQGNASVNWPGGKVGADAVGKVEGVIPIDNKPADQDGDKAAQASFGANFEVKANGEFGNLIAKDLGPRWQADGSAKAAYSVTYDNQGNPEKLTYTVSLMGKGGENIAMSPLLKGAGAAGGRHEMAWSMNMADGINDTGERAAFNNAFATGGVEVSGRTMAASLPTNLPAAWSLRGDHMGAPTHTSYVLAEGSKTHGTPGWVPGFSAGYETKVAGEKRVPYN